MEQSLSQARREIQRKLERDLSEVRHELDKYKQWNRADEIPKSGFLEKEAALVETIYDIEKRQSA